jgi:hypothetical protein
MASTITSPSMYFYPTESKFSAGIRGAEQPSGRPPGFVSNENIVQTLIKNGVVTPDALSKMAFRFSADSSKNPRDVPSAINLVWKSGYDTSPVIRHTGLHLTGLVSIQAIVSAAFLSTNLLPAPLSFVTTCIFSESSSIINVARVELRTRVLRSVESSKNWGLGSSVTVGLAQAFGTDSGFTNFANSVSSNSAISSAWKKCLASCLLDQDPTTIPPLGHPIWSNPLFTALYSIFSVNCYYMNGASKNSTSFGVYAGAGIERAFYDVTTRQISKMRTNMLFSKPYLPVLDVRSGPTGSSDWGDMYGGSRNIMKRHLVDALLSILFSSRKI